MTKEEINITEILNKLLSHKIIQMTHFMRIDCWIARLNEKLYAIQYKKNYRLQEKKNKNIIITNERLKKEFKLHLDDLKVKDPNPSYSPSLIESTINNEKIFFEECLALPLLKNLLSGKSILVDEEDFFSLLLRPTGMIVLKKDLTMNDIPMLRMLLLAIKKFLYLIFQVELITGITINKNKLLFLFHQINSLSHQMEKDFKKEEGKLKPGSKKFSRKTYAKIKDAENHEKYPELMKAIEDCKGKPIPRSKQSRNINRLIRKIFNTKSKKTMRKYKSISMAKWLGKKSGA